MDKAVIEHVAKLAEKENCTVVFLDKSIWTPQKLVKLSEALVKIAQEDAEVKVH